MTDPVFIGKEALFVITQGTGDLSLLSYGSNAGIVNHVGAKHTDKPGETHWIIGFSHTFTRFAFIWKGQGGAVYRLAESGKTGEVGGDWNNASLVKWREDDITEANVSSQVSSAVVRNNATTLWIIPETI